MVLADPTQIHQVVLNLCTNAAHAMDDQGVIHVSLSPFHLADDTTSLSVLNLRPGTYMRLSVSDTGQGNDAATMERIFDPYFTTKQVGKGSGLGLAVVHGIVKRHEGAIHVESELGKGTIFHVYIPRIEPVLGAIIDEHAALPEGNESVLLVDDEQPLAELGAEMLRRLGYKVVAKTGALDAFETFRASLGAFDLVISDYTMPQWTGADLAGRIQRIRPDMPLILCTGFSERITEERARSLGVMEFALKPLEMRRLAELVRKVLDKQKSRARVR